MKCKNLCDKDLTGRQKDFCSDKCRMQHKRVKVEQSKSNKPEQINPNTKVEQNKSLQIDLSPGAINCPDSSKVSFMSAKELYLAIHNYPQDTWKDSVEYKELMKRLHSLSIEELEAGGYRVPCWKYSEAA